MDLMGGRVVVPPASKESGGEEEEAGDPGIAVRSLAALVAVLDRALVWLGDTITTTCTVHRPAGHRP